MGVEEFSTSTIEISDEGSMQLLDGCSFLNGLEGFIERIKEDSMRSRKNSPLYLKSRRLTLAHLRQLKLLLAQNLGPGP